VVNKTSIHKSRTQIPVQRLSWPVQQIVHLQRCSRTPTLLNLHANQSLILPSLVSAFNARSRGAIIQECTGAWYDTPATTAVGQSTAEQRAVSPWTTKSQRIFSTVVLKCRVVSASMAYSDGENFSSLEVAGEVSDSTDLPIRAATHAERGLLYWRNYLRQVVGYAECGNRDC